ncbi:MAG TPA: HAD family phosphatase [Bacillota bacterium]|nr:HAD family phosphatase [Bacillota bacterium]HOG52640.1 HAD family phosphatase [Bacillota bacterium]
MATLPRLFCFDMDGTLTQITSSWEHLSRQLGIWEGNAEHHLTAFIKGEIDYLEFCRLDAMVLKGIDSSRVHRAIGTIAIDEGIVPLTSHLRDNGVKLALISSGLSILADRVLQVASFDYVFVNELEQADGVMTGGVKVNVSIDDQKLTKRAILTKLATEHGFGKEEIAAVGDNWGDHEMLGEAGTKFFVNRTPKETEKAIKAFSDIIVVERMDDICRFYSCAD